MKVLVTGGAGFIGSHIAELLLQHGHDVVVIDNLVTGKRDYVPEKATFYQMDIRDEGILEVFQKEQPHAVCHHAAQMSVLVSVREPMLDASVNILGGINLLNAAQQSGVQQFLFASSGGTVYGEPDVLPVDENAPLLPLSPYGISKLSFEHYLRISPFKTTIFRYANVYGPRQSPHGEAGVIAIFAERMLNGDSTVIYGDGNQERDFIYVTDVAEANAIALEQSIEGTFNIGTGMGTSVNEIYRLVSTAADYPHPRTHTRAKQGEVYKNYLRCQHAYQTLNWQPHISLEAGVAETVAFFKKNLTKMS